MGFTAEEVGLAGSPTLVSGIRPIESTRDPIMVNEGTVQERVRRAFGRLRDAGVLDGGRAKPGGIPEPWPETAAPRGRTLETWVLADIEGGSLRPAAAEHIGLARTLAAPTGGTVIAVLLGPAGTESLAPAAAEAGADAVVVGLSGRLAPYSSDAWSTALTALLEDRRPDLVIGAATRIGRGVLSRVAAEKGLGLTGDCMGIEWDGEGRLMHLKPAFGGNVIAPIYCRTKPELCTVVPGMVRPLAPRTGRKVPLDVRNLDIEAPRVAAEGEHPSARSENRCPRSCRIGDLRRQCHRRAGGR